MKHLLLTTIAAVVLVGCGPSPSDLLIEAARVGSVEMVRHSIDAGANVNTEGGDLNMTPLHYVASRRSAPFFRKQIAELLIANGADVNARCGDWGETPLHEAVSWSNKEVAEVLISKGADVNSKIMSGPRKGKTPLNIATHPDNPNKNKKEIADLLRKHGGKTKKELKAEGK